jgi:hypothetical protein
VDYSGTAIGGRREMGDIVRIFGHYAIDLAAPGKDFATQKGI